MSQQDLFSDEAPVASKKVEDAGEILAGAAKLIWGGFNHVAQRDYTISGQDYSKKDFPKIPYDKLLSSGVDAHKLAAIKAAEFSIEPKGRRSWKVTVWNERFANLMQFIQSLLADDLLLPVEIIRRARLADSFQGLADRVMLGMELGFPYVHKMGKAKIDYYNVALYYAPFGADGRRLVDMECKTYDDAIKSLREHLSPLLDSKTASSQLKSGRIYKLNAFKDTVTGDYFVGYQSGSKNPIRLATGFSSFEKVKAFAKENKEALQKKISDLKADKPYWIADLDIRKGRVWTLAEEISSDDILNLCDFRGVQYGNWVDQAERRSYNFQAYNGLCDLAEVVGLDVKSLGFYGDLGLAFGARGQGRGKASAHFEPLLFNINLTKTRGRGSMSHEWGHALDAYLGAFALTGEYDHRRVHGYASCLTKLKQNHLPVEIQDAMKAIMAAIDNTALLERSVKKDQLRAKDYWSTTVEMFARCFEAWVFYTMKKNNTQNGWLIALSDTFITEEDYPYPTPQEMETHISDAFDGLFEALVCFGGLNKIHLTELAS